MRLTHLPAIALAALLLLTPPAQTQSLQTPDSDHDGLSDALEQSLLAQFAPTLMIGTQECANLPAQFVPELTAPTIAAEDGTLYGQASPIDTLPPASTRSPEGQTVELHYYHLWKVDCGPRGHLLDAEHVSVLIHNQTSKPDQWEAMYWYAAAHEDTVCDASQIARASTLHAEHDGATIWISPGKHASFLNHELCRHGCGADHCDSMKRLATSRIVNLGEPSHPMNGALWASSSQWPLSTKMTRSDFPAEPVARLETLPSNDIAWFNSGPHPAQYVIAAGGSTAEAIGTGSDNTITAISLAEDSTGNALEKSYRNTIHALGSSAQHVGSALHLTPPPDQH